MSGILAFEHDGKREQSDDGSGRLRQATTQPRCHFEPNDGTSWHTDLHPAMADFYQRENSLIVKKCFTRSLSFSAM